MQRQCGWKIVLLFVVGMLLPNVMLAQEAGKSGEKKEVTNLRVEVTVKGSGGPVEGADVHAEWNEEEGSQDATTNKNGVAKLPDVPRGKVLIQVTKGGCQNFGKRYDLDQAQQTIKIELQPDTDHWRLKADPGKNPFGATQGNTVTKLRAGDGGTLSTFTVGTGPAAVAFDGTNSWVTNA